MRRAARRIIPTEHQEQSAVVQWWKSYGPTRGYDHRLLIAIPNGSVLAGDARRRAIQSRRLKDEGMQVGSPDLFLAIARTPYAGLFIEMKRANWAAPSSGKGLAHWENQQRVHDILVTEGYYVVVCKGANAAVSVISGYL